MEEELFSLVDRDIERVADVFKEWISYDGLFERVFEQARKFQSLTSLVLQIPSTTQMSDHTVSLMFDAVQKCTFKKRVEERKRASSHLERGMVGNVVTVSEEFLEVSFVYSFVAKADMWLVKGTRKMESLWSALSKEVLLESAREDEPPRTSRSFDPLYLDVSWLLQQFAVLQKDICTTPRRNPQVEKALQFATSLIAWADQVEAILRGTPFEEDRSASLDDLDLIESHFNSLSRLQRQVLGASLARRLARKFVDEIGRKETFLEFFLSDVFSGC